MTKPLHVDLPHQLGREEARRRIAANIGKLTDKLPGGGTAQVTSSWQGDRMALGVTALGQTVNGHIDVEDALVRLELNLPGLLGMFGGLIEQRLREEGPKLLK